MIDDVIEYTNNRLNAWYAEVFNVYGIVGEGTAFFDGTNIVIEYVEDGEKNTWSSNYFEEEKVSYYFDVWMEHG